MTWKDPERPPSTRSHAVQFYGDEADLADRAALYLQEGADRGEHLIVIATDAHWSACAERLKSSGVHPAALEQEGRLFLLEARETLSRIQVGGEPDWTRFNILIGSLIRRSLSRAGKYGVRAYGELVDLLWKGGRLHAATTLEGFWNRLLETHPFHLFCAYETDLLAPGARGSALQEILGPHSQLHSSSIRGDLENAVDRALRDVLGLEGAEALRPLIRANVLPRVLIPEAERTILWLLHNLPSQAEDVLARARRYYGEDAAQIDREPVL